MIAVSSLALALPVAAATDPVNEPEGWTYQLWRELMSPFCPGLSLADCPSSSAESLRTWILLQEASGRSRSDVEADLLERYGDTILAAPRPEGIGLAAYAIPALVLVAGGVLLGVFLKRQTGARPPLPSAEALDPDLARRVDEELAGHRARIGSRG